MLRQKYILTIELSVYPKDDRLVSSGKVVSITPLALLHATLIHSFNSPIDKLTKFYSVSVVIMSTAFDIVWGSQKKGRGLRKRIERYTYRNYNQANLAVVV